MPDTPSPPRVPRVLVIDDDEAIRKLLCTSLEHFGYAVTATAEAREGAELLSQEHFDAVMVDVQMPGMTGHAFLRATGDLERRPPIIMISGASGIDDAIEGFRGGIADFLTKPFTPRDAAAAVARVLEVRRAVPKLPAAETWAPTQPAPLPPPGEAAEEGGVLEIVRRELTRGEIKLPMPPAVLEEVLAVEHRSDMGTAQVVKILEKLPQGAARVLHLMKTPTYGFRGSQKFGLAEAVQRLGVHAAVSSAVTAALKESFRIEDRRLAETARKMWENSIVTAGLMRVMAPRTGGLHPESAYLLGLFHNLGELLYLRVYAGRRSGHDDTPLEVLAEEIAEHHGELGFLMARLWKLDELTCDICRHHHDPSYFEGTAGERPRARLAALVVLANQLAIQINGSYLPSHPEFPDLEFCRRRVGIKAAEVTVLLEDGKQTVHDLRAAFAG